MLRLGAERSWRAPCEERRGVWRREEEEAGGAGHGQGQCWSPSSSVADAAAAAATAAAHHGRVCHLGALVGWWDLPLSFATKG